MWFLALTIVEIECCIWMDCTLLSWSHSCKDVLSQIDSARGVSGSCSYPREMAAIWTDLIKLWKKWGMRKILGFAQTNLALLHSYLQGWARTKHHLFNPNKAAPCRECCKSADILAVISQGFEAHSQFKEMDCDDKRELSLLYPHMLGKLPWKCSKFPLLLPQMSVPQAQTQLFL